jgi:hypothetical protein
MEKITARSWSDDENDTTDDDLIGLKSSLEEALSDVSDRESLSQQEMTKRVIFYIPAYVFNCAAFLINCNCVAL